MPQPEEPLPRRRGKRLFDVVVAGGLLLAATPVFVVIAVCAALEMLFRPAARGPLLYREQRISHGRRFTMLKFRTVRQSALIAAQAQADFKTVKILEREDANLTHTGRWLKRWYLDELPQLINVFRGDMSFVGPRPWPPADHAQQLRAGINTKGMVPCGLTGLVQCHKGVPSNDRQLDLDYIDAYRRLGGWRLLCYDLGIMWRSLRVLRQGKGL